MTAFATAMEELNEKNALVETAKAKLEEAEKALKVAIEVVAKAKKEVELALLVADNAWYEAFDADRDEE